MTSLWLLACVPVVMWTAQTLHLKALGLPIRWRIDAGNAPKQVRTLSRIVTQFSLLTVILVYPLLKGWEISDYYAGLLPPGRVSLQCVHGAAAAILFLCVLYGIWIATERLIVCVHQSRQRWMRRLVLLLPTACFGALVEELLFRGVVMADLLQSTRLSETLVVVASVIIFAAAHYVRSVKRRWTFFGHLMLGLLLCIAFLETHALWLPIGLHAGGIAMIMGTRPFVRYQGPTWLMGASIYPFSGVAGIVGLAILTTFVANYYGGH